MRNLIIIFLYVITIASVGCLFSSKKVTITFNNYSAKIIDSAIVYVQNYRFALTNIPIGGSVQKQIPKDSIQYNQHDFMVRVRVYDQRAPDGKEGIYYDDLTFAGSEDKFIITATPALNVSIVVER
jgi:hypothetical protein